MTSHHDQETFGLRFEDAVNESHTRESRGMNPSPRTWKTIQAGLTQRAETADPRASGPDLAPVSRKTQQMREEPGMDSTLNPGIATSPPQRANRGLFAWVAIALVGVLIASSLFWFGQTPAGDGQNDVAWAPGLGTAESSPAAQAGESLCSVEPLTTDEVMETVLNPNNGYRRLGNTSAPNSESLWEPAALEEPAYMDPAYWSEDSLSPVEDADQVEMLVAMGNEFWNCMQSGTAYQVWGILDPAVVQRIILYEFPVLRSEADLRAFIETTGPQPFRESDVGGLTSLIKFDAENEAQVIEGEDGLLFTPQEESSSFRTKFGIIRLEVPGEDFLKFAIHVKEGAPGVWVIYGVYPITPDS